MGGKGERRERERERMRRDTYTRREDRRVRVSVERRRF